MSSRISKKNRPLFRRVIRLGASQPVVGEVLGVSRETIRSTLLEEGRGLPSLGTNGVIQYAKLHGRRVSDVKRSIVRAYRNGVALSALAGRYHASPAAVREVLVSAGVTVRPAARPNTQQRVKRAAFETRSRAALNAKRQICAACRELLRKQARCH